MTKAEIIKEASKDMDIKCYYSYAENWKGQEYLISNFDKDAGRMTDNRLIKLCEKKVLKHDGWGTYFVNVK